MGAGRIGVAGDPDGIVQHSDGSRFIMSDIAVSVVIPCYNAASSIEQTVASVLAQRHVCEVIIVDDGSSDDSVPIARSIAGPVDVVSGPNRGACHARNCGLARARGSHVLFLDADDTVEPGFVDGLAAVASRDDVDIVMGGHRHVAADGKTIALVSYDGATDSWSVLDGYLRRSVQTGALLWRRDWLQAAEQGWDETLPIYQDIDYVIRMLLRHPRIALVPGPPYAIWQEHDSPTRITNTLGRPKAVAIQRVLSDTAASLRRNGREDLLIGLARRAYGLARRCYAADLDDVGDAALRSARDFGLRGHSGSRLQTWGSMVVGLKRQTKLTRTIKRRIAKRA